MFFRRYCILIAVLTALLPLKSVSETLPSVSARSWAVYDMESRRFLAVGGDELVLPMASTTKIMTAMIVCEEYDLDRTVEIGPDCCAEGSSMYLREGERITVRDLLCGLLLMSGNDAAAALAGLYSGGEEAFVARMNERAAELGLKETAFVTVSGLDAEGHHATARELALLTAAAMEHPVFREIVSKKTVIAAGRTMQNHNKLLTFCADCIGVKTGYTKRAGRCLVSAFDQNGSTLIVVTLDAPDDWNDHIRLKEWAAENYPAFTLANCGKTFCRLPLYGGAAERINLAAGSDMTARLSAAEAEQVTMELYVPHYIYAPVAAGERCGYAVFLLNGKELGRCELIAGAAVERTAPKK